MERTAQKFHSCLCTSPRPQLVFINSFESSKAYKHVFTSPSSVDNAAKATRSGNARIHGMIHVTPASIAYIATQVCISLHEVHLHVTDHIFRHGLHSAPRPYSLGLTRSLIRRDSITAFWTFYMMLMSRRKVRVLSYGGIGKLPVPTSTQKTKCNPSSGRSFQATH
jgi:hypothetical protein